MSRGRKRQFSDEERLQRKREANRLYASRVRALMSPQDAEKRREYHRKYMAVNGHKYKQTREYRFIQKYGMTETDYDRMFSEQRGVCAICKNPETRKTKSGHISPLVIDHNHKTEEVRALLCHNCNSAFGLVKENITVLQGMIEYADLYNQEVAY